MHLNGSLVNSDGSHYSGDKFSSIVDPRTVNVNVLPQPLNNVQGAASYIPCQSGGRKINRRKINKISRKYKMKGSRKHISRKVRRMKSRVRSRYNRKGRIKQYWAYIWVNNKRISGGYFEKIEDAAKKWRLSNPDKCEKYKRERIDELKDKAC